MPFCRECGKGVESDWKVCPYCAVEVYPGSANTPKKRVEESCPECGKPARSLRTCRVCDEAQFCSHCHSQRKRDVMDVGFRWYYLYYEYNSRYEEVIKTKKGNLSAEVKRDIESFGGCLDCCIEHFPAERHLTVSKKFGETDQASWDHSSGGYAELLSVWARRKNETK